MAAIPERGGSKRVVALAFALSALADFTGRMVKVADPDTLTVLFNRKQIRVRLDGIGVPEGFYFFGTTLGH
jgi:micrococcal nuclease